MSEPLVVPQMAHVGHNATITFDGWMGSGKTSASLAVCAILNRRNFSACQLSSGSFYRTVALVMLERAGFDVTLTSEINLDWLMAIPEAEIIGCLNEANLGLYQAQPIITPFDTPLVLRVEDLDHPRIAAATPIMARWPLVRQMINQLILDFRHQYHGILLADGRDMAEVFSQAPGQLVKTILTVSEEVAAQRRGVSVEAVRLRNYRDRAQTQDDPSAFHLDTSHLTKTAVAEAIDGYMGTELPMLGNGTVTIFGGGPKAGKGVQATAYAQSVGAVCLSSGELLRQIDSGNGLGTDSSVMRRGGLVSSATFQAAIEQAILAVPSSVPIVLDGVAKKPAEAPWLLALLARLNRHAARLVWIDIDYDTMLSREGRGRHDDADEVLAERWERFATETTQSLNWLADQLPQVIKVDGRQSVAKVRADIVGLTR